MTVDVEGPQEVKAGDFEGEASIEILNPTIPIAVVDKGGHLRIEIEVDGGINPQTIAEIAGAGATVLVAGSAVFNNRASVAENIQQLRSHLPN